jgi:Protein of unknown function (DUF4013)
MSLRAALRVLHADRDLVRKVLIGGALMSSLFGYPFACGLVIESLDNTRKGYPTPLPPWGDWSSRYILGLFAFLIDFIYFFLPFFLAGLIFFCAGLVSVIGQTIGIFNPVISFVVVSLGAWLVAILLSGVSAVGRLIFVQDSSPEQAMSIASLREALRPAARGVYLRARLVTLPAYLPALIFGALIVLVVPSSLPFSLLIALLLYWLMMSALLYAQLVTIQVYAGADAELQRRGLDRQPA